MKINWIILACAISSYGLTVHAAQMFVGENWPFTAPSVTSTAAVSGLQGDILFENTNGRYWGFDGTRWTHLGPTVPTVTTKLSGSGTYTAPTGTLYIKVRLIGGGSGGGGSGSSAGGPGTSGDTTFGTMTGYGASGNSGGSFAGCDFGLAGGNGGNADGNTIQRGPSGGNGVFGGGAPLSPANTAGGAAVANSGGGGAGAGNQTTGTTGAGGGAGGYCEKVFSSLSPFSYSVAGGGSGGSAGTGGKPGGAGGSGVIIIEEFAK